MAISELDLPVGMVAHSLRDAEQQAQVLAAAVAQALRFALHTEGEASLLVPGGRSPVAFLEALSKESLDWSKVRISLTDERWVAPDHPDSNQALVQRHLLQREAQAAQFISLYTPAANLEQAAQQADQALACFQRPIDVVVLGMGEDGHTASLFPDNPGLRAALAGDCPKRCVPMIAPAEPKQRLSLSYPILASARQQYLLIQGHGKFLALSRALHATALHMPVHAFLHHPLEIYWCP